MPPIQLHKNDPIAASKPTALTPQTASLDDPTPTRTTPLSTPATTTQSSLPPPPQPGARPIPPTASPAAPTSTSTDPPPPAPSYTAHSYTAHHLTTETRLSSPPQYDIPPPDTSNLAGRSTTTAPTRTGPGPTTLPQASPFQAEHSGGAVGRPSLEGPAGYQQAADNSPYAVGGGALGTGGVGGTASGAEEGVGAQAWGMLARAGEALKKGEEAIWKAVREK